MRPTLVRHATTLLLLGTIAGTLLASWGVSRAITLPADGEFNFASWHLRHVPAKWLYLTGRFFRGGLSSAEEDERIGRYLVLSAEIRIGELLLPDDAGVEGRRDERSAIENDVEAIIEGRLTSLLDELDVESSLPLFPELRWVWPPVDVEFDEPPRSLAISPRDRIELVGQRSLRPGLSTTEVAEIEAEVERDGERSASAEQLAGISTYPSIVAPGSDYRRLVETVAHEWVHHYLTFKPLGVRYERNLELQTLNETVADLAGVELAALFVERYPLPPTAVARLSELTPTATDVDVGAELAQLRREVEWLLALGDVTGAEALMEERRLQLAEQGVLVRRINQAFFAFRNIYAGGPVSIDPIGGKVAALRGETDSIGAFLRAAGGLRSEADLDRLLGGG